MSTQLNGLQASLENSLAEEEADLSSNEANLAIQQDRQATNQSLWDETVAMLNEKEAQCEEWRKVFADQSAHRAAESDTVR